MKIKINDKTFDLSEEAYISRVPELMKYTELENLEHFVVSCFLAHLEWLVEWEIALLEARSKFFATTSLSEKELNN